MASKAASHVGSQYFYPNMVTGRVYNILLVVVDFFLSFIFKMTVQFYETINLHVYQMLCLCSRWNAFAIFSRDRTENSDAAMTEIRKEFSAKKTHPFASVVTKWPKWEFLKREKKSELPRTEYILLLFRTQIDMYVSNWIKEQNGHYLPTIALRVW